MAEHKIEGIYDQEPLPLAVNDFVESIQFARMPLSDGEFSLKVLAALEAGEQSLRPGKENLGRKLVRLPFSLCQARSFLILMNKIHAPVQSQVSESLGNRIDSSILHLFLLAALCGALYFPYLGSTPFFDKGGPREALAVQDIVQRGEWLFPLKKATDIPSKPPLFHWSAALASEVTGQLSESTVRFPSAVYATFGVLVLYLFGRRLFGAEIALLGGAIVATTMVYQNQALSARVDMTLCFYVTASLVLFYSLYRGFLTRQIWYYVFFALIGVSMLAKGPLGLLLPALVIAAFLALKDDGTSSSNLRSTQGCF